MGNGNMNPVIWSCFLLLQARQAGTTLNLSCLPLLQGPQ